MEIELLDLGLGSSFSQAFPAYLKVFRKQLVVKPLALELSSGIL